MRTAGVCLAPVEGLHSLSSQNRHCLCLPHGCRLRLPHILKALQLDLQLHKSALQSNTFKQCSNRYADMILPSCLYNLDHPTPWPSFPPLPLPSHILRDSEVRDRTSHSCLTTREGSQARRRHGDSRGTYLVALGP